MTLLKQPLGGSASPGGGSDGEGVVDLEFEPTEGQTLLIPESNASIINVLIWPAGPLLELQLALPEGMVPGRRVLIYANQSIGQLTITAGVDATVANGVASMNENDLLVFNTVSTVRKIWARVANT